MSSLAQERPRLVGHTPLALCAVAAVAGLVALHADPRTGQPLASGPIDAVQIAYLRANLAHDPNNVALRLRLSHQLLSVGAFVDAERTLAPLLEPAQPGNEVLRLAVEIAAAQWRATSHEVPARKDAERRLMTRLAQFAANQLSPADQAFVSNLAREAEHS